MPDDTLSLERDGAGTAPADAGSDECQVTSDECDGEAAPEARYSTLGTRTFTQEDVDRIITERLRRERSRLGRDAEKAVRDELEGAQQEARAARGEAETLGGALREAEQRALVAERLLAKGVSLPLPYLAQIRGEDEGAVDAAIDAAREQWAADVRRFARPAVDVGSRVNPQATARNTRPALVDEALADRMRRGETEAFREYRAIRP
jgi:hypothetical protein